MIFKTPSNIFIPRTLRVLKCKNTTDWFSFNQAYSPLLNKEEVLLFMNLYSQNKIESFMKIESYEYEKFISNYSLTFEKAEKAFSNLSKLGLITITDTEELRTIKLEKVKPLNELMKESSFNHALKQKLTEDKYLELVYITGESELELVGEAKEELTKQTYAAFYSGVRELLGTDFSLSNEAISIIKHNEENLSMKELHECANLSAVKSDGKFSICPIHLDFLIKQALYENKKEINLDEHQFFWRELTNLSDEDIKKHFKKLFCRNNPFTLYQLLTSKDKCPDALQKWIKVCIQDQGFKYPIINALCSFVMCLLGKIPVNYLVKVSNTLNSQHSPTTIGLIRWAKNVIVADVKAGKNRLNVKIATNNAQQKTKESKEKSEVDVSWYFPPV